MSWYEDTVGPPQRMCVRPPAARKTSGPGEKLEQNAPSSARRRRPSGSPDARRIQTESSPAHIVHRTCYAHCTLLVVSISESKVESQPLGTSALRPPPKRGSSSQRRPTGSLYEGMGAPWKRRCVLFAAAGPTVQGPQSLFGTGHRCCARVSFRAVRRCWRRA